MLTDDYPMNYNATLLIVAGMLGGGPGSHKRVSQGVYTRGSFGHNGYVPGWEDWPKMDNGSPYGVCDNYQQILVRYPELQAEDRTFVVFMTRVTHAEQPDSGGWRWHKWGEYIGTHELQHEYLYDEKGIEEVFCYHIYEKVGGGDRG